MKVVKSLIDLIGQTPMLDISELVPKGGAKLYLKLEMMNPGGSIKDRPALAMIEAAEASGELKPGGTIVEPTAGNTGIGLALVGNLKGYKTVFFVPDRMSQEKIVAMQLYGAEVILVAKEEGMKGCIARAQAYAAERPNCYVPQQFENQANPQQAECRLGPEIAEQLGFVPDGLAIGAGTGGTFTGLSRWLKAQNPDAKCWLVQPVGSIFKGGEKGDYQIEGIGNSFIPGTLDLSLADDIRDIADPDSFRRCRDVASHTGLLIGGSTGANIHAAIDLCMELGEGKTVFTVAPDTAERYTSKPWVQKLAMGEIE